MKRGFVLFALLISAAYALSAFAQPPSTLWTRTYGAMGTEYGYSAQQTLDGGFIMTGYSSSFGAPDFYLVKTNANGDTLWTRRYGGPAPETAYSLDLCADGGYIQAGYTFSYGAGAMDFYLVKTNSTGDTVWTRTFGGSNMDLAQCVRQTTDGGYIVAGAAASFGAGSNDFYLVKTNASGVAQWTRTYGGAAFDNAQSVQQTTDGGYIVAGYTTSYGAGAHDLYLIKTNSAGDTLWTRTYGGLMSDYAYSVQQTTDGGYIMAGAAASYSSSMDIYVVKTNSNGDPLWSHTYGETGVNDYGENVQQTTDGGYIIAGYTDSYGVGSIDLYLIRLDASGNTRWTLTYGGIESDQGYSVQQTTDGGFIVAGQTMSFGAGNMDFYLLRLAAESPTLPVTMSLGPINPPIQIPAGGGTFDYNVLITNTGTAQVTFNAWIMTQLPYGTWFGPLLGPLNLTLPAGVSLSRLRSQAVPGSAPAGIYTYTGLIGTYPNSVWASSGFYFIKQTGADGPLVGDWGNSGESFESYLTPGSDTPLPGNCALSQNYPNPFNPLTAIRYQLLANSYVKLSVYDLAGRLVEMLVNGYREAGVHQVTFDASELASGIYLYRLEAGEFTAIQKMVLMK